MNNNIISFWNYLRNSSLNIVKGNNFINNKYQDFFDFSRFNLWIGNYWDDWSKIFPRPVYGKKRLESNDEQIEWINFDWYPAREPYDIPELA